jgi:hypothetical protein
MAAQLEESLVSLKVMRLCRPSLLQQQPVPLPIEAVGMQSPGVAPSVGLTGWLTLPQSFGDIFLGETFSCFISLANISGLELTQIALKVEVQTQVQRETLSAPVAPPSGGSTPELDTLQPGQTLDRIIKYELKDVGVHILICSASFCDKDGDRRFRKFFKFQVPVKQFNLTLGYPGTAGQGHCRRVERGGCTVYSAHNLRAPARCLKRCRACERAFVQPHAAPTAQHVAGAYPYSAQT